MAAFGVPFILTQYAQQVLGYSAAQFVRLAWSIDAGEPIERPAIVACRYTRTDC